MSKKNCPFFLSFRLQPLCGKVSSVTQVHPVSGEKTDSEAGLIGKSESSQRKEEDMEEGERKEEARGEGEGEEKTTPGGVFAGVGKFSSTVKVNPKFFPQLKDLDMNYVKEATLRFVCGKRRREGGRERGGSGKGGRKEREERERERGGRRERKKKEREGKKK